MKCIKAGRIRTILILFILFITSPIFTSMIYAFDAPRIYVKELNVNQASINAGDGISGDFLMWNTASEIMSDLDYKVSLEQNHNAYGEEINHVSGQIYPDKTLRQDFSYKIPQNIQTGDYIFKIQLFSQSGMALNWGEKNIKIKGSAGGYLVIGSASVIKNGESNQPLKGVGFKIGEVPKIKFTASNPSSQEITFKPSVEIYWFQTNLDKTDEFFGESQILAVNESKEIEIAMPKYQKPGSYLASVVLSSDNIDVSNTEKFRWVLKGEGSRILNVKINNDLLKVGEDARITVEFIGSADALDKGEATLVVNLFDNSGKNLFSQERKVQLGDTVVAEVFSFIPTSYIANPRIEAKIIRNGKELNFYTAQIKTPGVEGGTEKTEDLSPIKQNYLLIGVIAIGLLIIIFIMARVLFRKMRLFLFVVLISAGFLFSGAGEIKAATVLWQEPVHDSIFNVGDPVTFKGNLTLSGCDNGIDYITKAFACDINLFNCIYMDKKYNYNLDPIDIAYDEANDKIYFPDYEGHRVVQVNATTGQIEKTWGNRCVISPLPGLPSDCRGNFNGVFGIFYDAIDEFIYVTDYGNDRIARFKPSDANILTNWKTYNKAGDSLKKPRGVFVDHPNSGITLIYVADSENSRIVRFRENNVAGTWATYGVVDPHIDPDLNPPIDGEFHAWESPGSVFFDAGSGYIYASDAFNNRVVRFKLDNAGNYIAGSWDDFHISPTGSGKVISVPLRAGYYQGWVYVAEAGQKIVRFKPDDNAQDYQILGSSAGSGVGQFNGPQGIIYDQNSEDGGAGSGYIYVANNGDKAIRKFKMDATGGAIAGTWVNFDYWVSQGYDFDFNLPTTFPSGFAFGDGVSNPLNAAYAYIEYEVIDTDDSDGANFASTTVEITGGGATTNATAKANVTARVDRISVTNKGSDYTIASVVIDPPPFPGVRATAVAVLNSSDEVGSITITNGGSGYTEIPDVNIIGDGDDAEAIVSIVKGAVTSYTITNPGSGYKSNPTVIIKGAGINASARAVRTGDKVTSIIVNNAGSNYNFAVDSSERIIINPAALTYSIRGNVFVDTNKNKVKDAGESNYTAAAPTITINYASANINVLANGTYTISNLPAGTYTVNYALLPAAYFMIEPQPPSFEVTVGPLCNIVNSTTGGECY